MNPRNCIRMRRLRGQRLFPRAIDCAIDCAIDSAPLTARR